MVKIKDAVGSIPEENLTADAPESPTTTLDDDLAQAVIETVVYQLLRPWKYGVHLKRIAKKNNLSLDQVKEIKKELDARLEELSTPEIVEVPAGGGSCQ